MQRNSPIPVLICAAILAGCNRSSSSVYVDVEQVLRQENAPWAAVPLPSPPPTRPVLTETAPGEPATLIEDPANTPKQSVQEMFQAEQASALADLQRRLRQFYHGEVEKFKLEQQQSIAGDERKAYADANTQIRALFDAWAADRAPTFAKLALIAGFPDPNPTSQPVDKALPQSIRRRNEEAGKLRAHLNGIDAKFDANSRAVLAGVQDKVKADQAALLDRVQEYASQLDKRAEAEARAQVRHTVSQLRLKLTNPTPVDLPATPPRRLSIPAESPLDPAPKVATSGILLGTADRRRLLDHELRIWLALNRYTLSESPQGHRDATQEFQKWRQEHGAGL